MFPKIDFIHIGYHKTASTWLQKKVFPQVPELFICNDARLGLERDFFDPFLLSDPFVFDRDRFLDGFSQAVRSKVPSLERYAVVGLSEESLSGDVVSGKDARLYADRLVEVFGPTRILIVIRNQIDLLLSIYSNYVVHGGTKNLPRFLGDLNLEAMRVFTKLRFCGLISYYRALHGAGNVYVECFEQMTSEPSPLHDFFASMGVTVEQIVAGGSANRGRSLLGNSVLTISNRIGAGHRYAAKLPVPDRRQRDRQFVCDLIPSVVDEWRADNRRLAALLGKDLPDAYNLKPAANSVVE